MSTVDDLGLFDFGSFGDNQSTAPAQTSNAFPNPQNFPERPLPTGNWSPTPSPHGAGDTFSQQQNMIPPLHTSASSGSLYLGPESAGLGYMPTSGKSSASSHSSITPPIPGVFGNLGAPGSAVSHSSSNGSDARTETGNKIRSASYNSQLGMRRQSSPAAYYNQNQNSHQSHQNMGPPPLPAVSTGMTSASQGAARSSNGASAGKIDGVPARPPLSQHHLSHPAAMPMVSHYRHNFYSNGFPPSAGGADQDSASKQQNFPYLADSRRGSAVEGGNDWDNKGDSGEEYGDPVLPSIYDPYTVKHRKRTTPDQLAVLEKAFEENSKPSAVARKMIADQIGMTPRSVQVWFQNRRQKRKMLERKRLEDGVDLEPDYNDLPSHAYPALLHIRDGPGNAYRSDVGEGMSGWSSHHPATYGAAQGRGMISITPSYPSGAGPITAPPLDQNRYMYRSLSNNNYDRRPSWTPNGQTSLTSPSTLQHGRRGSLPYPPPINTGFQASGQAGGSYGRTVSAVDRPAKSQIPLHVAISMGGRRASLPVNQNSTSISLGSFTPPRIGGTNQTPTSSNASGYRRELSPIQDQDHHLYSYDQQPRSALPPAINGSADMPGPLPNPSFSFGMNAGVQQSGPAEQHDSGLPMMISPAEYTSAHQQYHRERIGSMASLMTDKSTATADSDWNPAAFNNYHQSGLVNDPAMVVPSDEMAHLQLPQHFEPDARRASAPADLLDKFNVLEVKKPSPLVTSYTADQDAAKYRGTAGLSMSQVNTQITNPAEKTATPTSAAAGREALPPNLFGSYAF